MGKIYKVLFRDKKGRLFSWGKIGMGRGVYVFYSPNKWVLPKIKGSKLFACSSLKFAKLFLSSDCDQELWEVEVKGKKRISRCLDYNEFSSIGKVKKFWEGNFENLNVRVPFRRTIVCDEIKLVKRIE